MEFPIPESLKIERAELHAELVTRQQRAVVWAKPRKKSQDACIRISCARKSSQLPPLSLLGALATGKLAPGMTDVLALTDRLEAELSGMLGEHKEIVAALGDLVAAAKAENMPKYTVFAQKLVLHARTEEEVFYPAAILVGRYVKRVLGR